MMYNHSTGSYVGQEHLISDEYLPGNWSNPKGREIIDLQTDAGWPFLIVYTVFMILNYVAGKAKILFLLYTKLRMRGFQ